MTNQTKNSMLLMLCALIWGTAFVAQSAGSGMGAFSFLSLIHISEPTRH